MNRWLRWLRLGRAATGRAPLDVLFALAFVVFLGGVATIAWGVAVSDASAVPGLGIVAAVVGAYGSFIFGVQGARSERRSVLRSLGRGYQRMWHWVRPPRR